MKMEGENSRRSIYLYGYNKISVEKYKKMLAEGFSVRGIIDRKADVIREKSVPLYTLEQIKKKCIKNMDVIILLQNAFLHQEIAENLYSLGIKKILYVPMNGIDSKSSRLRLIYNDFMEDDFSVIRKIPNFILPQKLCIYENILYRTGKRVILSVPITKIYSMSQSTEIKKKMPVKLLDIPIINMKPYFHLWEYLEGKRNECQTYCSTVGQLMKNTRLEMNDMMVFQERFCQYSFFCKMLEINSNFFVTSAARAVWNEKGYFNIYDGLHRLTFLISRGMHFVPVSISVSDYEQWREYILKNIKKEIIDYNGLVEYSKICSEVSLCNLLAKLSEKITFADTEIYTCGIPDWGIEYLSNVLPIKVLAIELKEVEQIRENRKCIIGFEIDSDIKKTITSYGRYRSEGYCFDYNRGLLELGIVESEDSL